MAKHGIQTPPTSTDLDSPLLQPSLQFGHAELPYLLGSAGQHGMQPDLMFEVTKFQLSFASKSGTPDQLAKEMNEMKCSKLIKTPKLKRKDHSLLARRSWLVLLSTFLLTFRSVLIGATSMMC